MTPNQLHLNYTWNRFHGQQVSISLINYKQLYFYVSFDCLLNIYMQAQVDENFWLLQITHKHTQPAMSARENLNEKLRKKNKNDCLLIDACGNSSSSSKRMFLINLIAAVLWEWKLN